MAKPPFDTPSAPGWHYFSLDTTMRYMPFCDDFGPFNLGMTHHFCQVLKDLLCQRRMDGTKICYYTSTAQTDVTNALFLLGAFMVIHLDAHPEQAWLPFGKFASVVRPYRDATWCPSPYDLTLVPPSARSRACPHALARGHSKRAQGPRHGMGARIARPLTGGRVYVYVYGMVGSCTAGKRCARPCVAISTTPKPLTSTSIFTTTTPLTATCTRW